MIVYKAYHKKHGWTRDYKSENGNLLFNFGKGYVKCNNYCIGFEVLNDTDESSSQFKREKKIDDILGDYNEGFIFTEHLYKYSKNIKINYYELEKPYLLIGYNKGVFQFNYYYGGNKWIPISYVDDISGQYINLEDLELICNKIEDCDLVRKLFYGQ